MAKRRNQRGQQDAQPERMTVVVCRGGDCGSARKHPELDHPAQLKALRTGVDDGAAAVVPSKCLDACEHSNVLVVIPGRAGREIRAEPVWIGEANDMVVTDDVIEWVNSGGPGVETEPALVGIHAFRPARQSRRELRPGQALP